MKNIIFFISFFIYSGYFAGLAIIFALNLGEISKFYSVPLRLVLSASMVYVICKNWKNLINTKNSIYLFLFVLFWAIYILKVLYTENIAIEGQLSKEWHEFIYFSITYVVLPFITYLSIDSKKYTQTILDALIFSGFIMGGISTYLYGSLLSSGIGRIGLISYETGEDVLNPLALSYAGTLTIALCAHRLIINKKNNKNDKIYLYVTIAFAFVMFLLGSSRGSVIALLLTLPLFIYYSPFKRKIGLMFLTTLLIPVVIWLVERSGSNIFERIVNTREDKGGGRGTLWEDALNHFMDNPIFGGRIEIGGIYPHNLIIEMLMATGLIGTILMSIVIFKGFKLSFNLTRLNKNYLFIFIVLIQAFVQHNFTGSLYTSTLLFVPIAMVLNLDNNQV